jgi:hypothetical protein
LHHHNVCFENLKHSLSNDEYELEEFRIKINIQQKFALDAMADIQTDSCTDSASARINVPFPESY